MKLRRLHFEASVFYSDLEAVKVLYEEIDEVSYFGRQVARIGVHRPGNSMIVIPLGTWKFNKFAADDSFIDVK